jgi:hypothetical protein
LLPLLNTGLASITLLYAMSRLSEGCKQQRRQAFSVKTFLLTISPEQTALLKGTHTLALV